MAAVVMHRPEASRFELQAGSSLAVCSYRLADGVAVLHHTEVPAAMQGGGLAAALVAAALAWARASGLRVRPTCSYVATYMRRHPETQDLLERPGEPR